MRQSLQVFPNRPPFSRNMRFHTPAFPFQMLEKKMRQKNEKTSNRRPRASGNKKTPHVYKARGRLAETIKKRKIKNPPSFLIRRHDKKMAQKNAKRLPQLAAESRKPEDRGVPNGGQRRADRQIKTRPPAGIKKTRPLRSEAASAQN